MPDQTAVRITDALVKGASEFLKPFKGQPT